MRNPASKSQWPLPTQWIKSWSTWWRTASFSRSRAPPTPNSRRSSRDRKLRTRSQKIARSWTARPRTTTTSPTPPTHRKGWRHSRCSRPAWWICSSRTTTTRLWRNTLPILTSSHMRPFAYFRLRTRKEKTLTNLLQLKFLTFLRKNQLAVKTMKMKYSCHRQCFRHIARANTIRKPQFWKDAQNMLYLIWSCIDRKVLILQKKRRKRELLLRPNNVGG